MNESLILNTDDGILKASEIATMDLSKTDLVVLSACQTGQGEITGEGVFGLQRAFKKAGVGTILMSLQEVDDTATEILMTNFYKEYISGKSKHEALRLAQLKVIEQRGANPDYWASFILLD
jgi:CHAT domain-containing protein